MNSTTHSNNKTEKIIVLFGRSASGKSTIAKILVETLQDFNLQMFETFTTRAKRDASDNDYTFLTIEEFKDKQEKGEFIEIVHRADSQAYYGTGIPQSANTLMLLDLEGLDNIYKIYKGTSTKILTVLLDISQETSEKRMKIRDQFTGKTTDEQALKRRLQADAWEMNEFIGRHRPEIKINLEPLNTGNNLQEFKANLRELIEIELLPQLKIFLGSK